MMFRYLVLGVFLAANISSGAAIAVDAPPAMEDITLTTDDQVTLRGSYYAAAAPGPAVMLIHMCRTDADRRTWHNMALQLARSGIHTLTFDLRGYGESSGGEPPFTTMQNFISFWRSTGMNDVEAAHEFLVGQPGVDAGRIGIGGASCGVFLGVEAAARFGGIAALALLSGPFDQQGADTLEGLDGIPVLGAASEDDTRSYMAMKRVFLATKNPESRNIQFKGDAHGTDMFQVQPDLEAMVGRWFERHLIE